MDNPQEIPQGWISKKELLNSLPLNWQTERLVDETLDQFQLETEEVKWLGESERYMSPDIAEKVKEGVRKALS